MLEPRRTTEADAQFLRLIGAHGRNMIACGCVSPRLRKESRPTEVDRNRRGILATVGYGGIAAGRVSSGSRAFGSWLWSSRTLSCVLMVVGVCVSGCGGGAVSRSSTAVTLTPASTTTGSTTAKDTKTTGQPRIKSKTTASTLAGRVARSKRSRFVPPTRAQALLLSASSECAIARARAPSSPLPTTNRTTIVAYAAASRPTAARVAKSLGDLPGRKPPPVSRLIDDYRKLASAYAAASTHVSHGVSGDRLSQTLIHAEQRTAADALVARVPVCAPLPPSARGAKRK